MSTWGPRPQENDDAADWLADFEEEPGVRALDDAFDGVLLSTEYLEAAACTNAVVAAAVVAEALGQPSSFMLLETDARRMLESLVEQLAADARASLVERAIASVHVVMAEADRSGLHQLWHGDPVRARSWLSRMQGLEQRLLRIAACSVIDGAEGVATRTIQ